MGIGVCLASDVLPHSTVTGRGLRHSCALPQTRRGLGPHGTSVLLQAEGSWTLLKKSSSFKFEKDIIRQPGSLPAQTINNAMEGLL